MTQSSPTTTPKCYHRICTCVKPSTISQSCVTIGSVYHSHLSIDFPCFSDGRRSTIRKASLVTSMDQIARLAEPITPYLGHMKVRSRSRAFPLGAIPVPETRQNAYETPLKCCWPYRTTFLDLEMPYSTIDDVSKAFWPIRQPFRRIVFGL
jgi:hypothetical protein